MSRTRRLTLASVALATVLGSAVATPGSTATGEEPDDPRPNVLLVTTDDQAVADMAYMPFAREFFGRGGVTFTDAVSPHPSCCPARATILTGQLSHNHRVLSNRPPHGGYAAFRRETGGEHLGRWLQRAGYRTMFVGKFLNGYGKGRYQRTVPPGWDEWNATAGPGTYDYVDFNVNHDGQLTEYRDSYQTDVFGELTRGFVERHAEDAATAAAPFFVWESQLAPHGACYRTPDGCRWGPPMVAPEDEGDHDDVGLPHRRHGSFNEPVVRDKPRHVRRQSRWDAAKIRRKTGVHRKRAASLRAVDRSLRRTVDRLRALGELDDTLVILTSDHGFLNGEHRWFGKRLPYEASLRVPLLMRGPGVPAGEVHAETVTLADLAPTIAAAAGARPTVAPDGRRLQPLLRGAAGAAGYEALSIEAGPGAPSGRPEWAYRGVRTRRYTYAFYPGDPPEVELYDRLHDPFQRRNVADDPAYRETRATLADRLRRLRACQGAGCRDVGGGVPGPAPGPLLEERADRRVLPFAGQGAPATGYSQ